MGMPAVRESRASAHAHFEYALRFHAGLSRSKTPAEVVGHVMDAFKQGFPGCNVRYFEASPNELSLKSPDLSAARDAFIFVPSRLRPGKSLMLLLGEENVRELDIKDPRPNDLLAGPITSNNKVKGIFSVEPDCGGNFIFTGKTSPLDPFQFAYNIAVAASDHLTILELQGRCARVQRLFHEVSHEIRGPLGTIFTSLAVLKKIMPANAAIERILGRIDRGLFGFPGLLASYAQLIDEAAEAVELKEINLRSILHGVEEKYVDLTNLVLVEQNVPENIVTDERRLVRAISEITSNALKYSPDNPNIKLRIRMVESVEYGTEIQFSISDNGPGIPKSKQAGLFDRSGASARLDPSKALGTGWGLHTVALAVKEMGGRIWVESPNPEYGEKNIGSVFHFTVPASTSLI